MASRRGPAAGDAGYDDMDMFHERTRHNRSEPRREKQRTQAGERQRRRQRTAASGPFKCRRCKAFIGLPLTGGRQRNHCPSCLHSLHVDGKTPGDRASSCRSLMAPLGTFFRPNGEQVLVHHCLGCGFERHNRVAADDNPLLLMRLALVAPRPGADAEEDEEKATTA